MSNVELGLWSFPVLLLLIFLRMPIGLAMLIVGVVGNYLITKSWNPSLALFKSLTFSTFSSYSFAVVPLFLLMGQFAAMSGVSRALFDAAASWLGHRKGGIAMASIGACAAFGSICGSSLATAATMGQIALPELKRHNYSGALATGTLAAGGTIGILVPPSWILVIYAILTEQNIAKLFLAAIVPGILAAVGYCITIAIVARLKPESAGTPYPRVPYRERFKQLGRIWPAPFTFVLVIGGIYTGIFTPTEAAAVGALGTALIAIFNRTFTWPAFRTAMVQMATGTGMIFMIILGAAALNNFLALSQLPQVAAAFVTEQGFNPWVVMTLILIMYLILGGPMDSLSMILLTIPVVYPVTLALDFGLSHEEFSIWFGVLTLVVVEVGLISPPVGMNLFVINSMSKGTSMGQTFAGVTPFLISDLVRTVILVAFPSISLFLVQWLF
ncbi:TRAP transporter large permease [Devosia sp. CN2-171]|uniref:TRAP transporter large permease n=1 Tax=Devosia sp. CN2-171 TaxID=3400909 RepID=UPI003BF8DCB7